MMHVPCPFSIRCIFIVICSLSFGLILKEDSYEIWGQQNVPRMILYQTIICFYVSILTIPYSWWQVTTETPW